MRIVIDARMYGLEHAGIGRYVSNLINSLEKIDKNNDYFLLLRKKYFDSLKIKEHNFHKILADYSHYSLREQILLPFKLLKLNPDLVHFPHFNAPFLWWGNQIVTIHDLIKNVSKGSQTTTRNQSIYWLKYFGYRLLLLIVILRAKKILVPSNWVKKSLAERYRVGKEKVIVTYEGVDHNVFSPEINNDVKVLENLKIKKPYLIFTGSLYPHKNVVSLVEAAKILNMNLVISSARNIFMERFKENVIKMGAGGLVNFVGFVPDDQLSVLYREAVAFVFPSFVEGFGLPGLEAMAAGCSVIASNSSCLPEIYGESAIYFDPKKTEELVGQIKKLHTDPELRKALIAKGKKQAKRYSWDEMARKTQILYETCASL